MNDILGNDIGRCRLGSKNHSDGAMRQISLLNLKILVNGKKSIHLLALIFVQTLDLHVENRGRINNDSLRLLQEVT